MAIVKLQGYRCDRCEHEWMPRSKVDSLPTICPKCKSPYWNKPRMYTYEAILKKGRDGMYSARCKELHANSDGQTKKEAEQNIREAIELAVESLGKSSNYSVRIVNS